MPLVQLDDDQMSAVINACPLEPAARSAFLAELAVALDAVPPDLRGPGTVHRLIAELQRRWWSPPDLSRSNGQTRWSRSGRKRAPAEA
jgi:hypothetical protein